MPRKKDPTIADSIRVLSALPEVRAHLELSRMRSQFEPNKYFELVSAAKIALPRMPGVLARSPKQYKELAFYGPARDLGLHAEVRWIVECLKVQRGRYNEHFSILRRLQKAFVLGSFAEVQDGARRHIERFGWSFWATDLLFLTTQKLGGMSSLRALAGKLQEAAEGRPSSVYTMIATDRNDDSMPYESFTAKCERSFSRFNPEWFGTYATYRALGTAETPEKAFATVLSVDMVSSAIDAYESLIDCLTSIQLDQRLVAHRSMGAGVCAELLASGFSDYRFRKLLAAFDASAPLFQLDDCSVDELELSARLLGIETSEPERQIPEFLASIHEKITQIESIGFIASEEGSDLLKLGFNAKSLPIGSGLAQKSVSGVAGKPDDPLLGIYVGIATPDSDISQILSYRDQDIVTRIEALALEKESSGEESEFLWLRDVVRGEGVLSSPPRSTFTLWLARFLFREDRLDEAFALCEELDSFGSIWARKSAGLKILISREQGNLQAAVEHAAAFLVRDFRYAFELPLRELFSHRSWSDFKHIDPELIGFVAHYANFVYQDSNTRYIVRMSCRKFASPEIRSNLESRWASKNTELDKAVLIAFLEDAWIDENLVLIESFTSVHDVRRERIEIMQYLLDWNPNSQGEYSETIRQMTLDETLWRGLKHIDETRIFVNESAISRWAEKDLQADFERWRNLRQLGPSSVLEGELVRSYFMNPSVESLVRALPEGQATEVNALLFDIVDRLFTRFMTDPADGLESYLSLRIRHGTLRGTLLGPLEQENLLLSGDASEQAFRDRWAGVIQADPWGGSIAVEKLRRFTLSVSDVVRKLVEGKVQINSAAKPLGAFPAILDPASAPVMQGIFPADVSFAEFLSECYALFWVAIKPHREALGQYVLDEVKPALQRECDALIESFADQPRLVSLVAAIRTAGTIMQNQCEVVAGWFTRESEGTPQAFSLSEAVEIAKRATSNVHRQFGSEIRINGKEAGEILLSANGLAVVYDCLYVIFENAWKHSGIGSDLQHIDLGVTYDPDSKILTMKAVNELAAHKRQAVEGERLRALKSRYLTALPLELVAKEGGSGFAKLARAVRFVDRSRCPVPLDFDVIREGWVVSVSVPLYERNGLHDAFV